MGAHRRFMGGPNGFSLVVEETFRRLWWVCYLLDRMMSAHLGRPMCIRDEDVDAEEMLPVDDEHLAEASEEGQRAAQAGDTPSVFTGFFHSVRLARVSGKGALHQA
jgi:hypothetical protein